MKKLRGVFDPEGILNPGRVVRYPEDVWQNPKEAWDYRTRNCMAA